MAGQGRGYREFLSQSSSSSAARTFPASHAAAADDDNDYGFYPDARTGPSVSASRADLQNLDLNSQVDEFPFLDSYSGLLRREDGCGEVHPLGTGGRSGHAAFQPPRPTGGRGAGVRGGHSTGRHSRSAGGGRGPLMANRSARGATAAVPQVVGGHGWIEGEDDNVPQSVKDGIRYQIQGACHGIAGCSMPTH